MIDDPEHPTLPLDNGDTTTQHPSGVSPTVIGHYRLLQKVGEGGMGEVWEAEQTEPVRRKVAVKIIKPGMDSREVVARFETERQALAMMDHPCIAKVFDAGATEQGRPYFVMEFVRGIPITDHCDRHHLNTRERLDLFMQVCEGVQHAHQKAIIHRDIKPSNVLVSLVDGKAVPKIIDFGVAKATAQRLTEKTMYTELGQMIGTPDFMSPEQAELTGQNIDTRTDVYALGVLLYVLLVGALPFDPKRLRKAGFDEIRRKIREDDPPRPSLRLSTAGQSSALWAESRGTDTSSLTSQLRGDLDWITMKALEKDRTRRYGSPSELAADILRHLRDEPVLASPPSTIYRLRKFTRRHRVGVTSTAVLLVLLVAFAITMTVQAGRIARERDRANLEAVTAQQVSDFLVDLFEVSDPSEALGNTITAREILDKGAVEIRQELRDQPRVQARLMDTIGEVYRRLGLYDASRPLLHEALKILRDDLGDDHLDVARSLEHLAILLVRTGEFEAARPLLDRSLAIREQALGAGHPDVASVLNNLGILHAGMGDYAQAREYYQRTLDIREKAYGPDHLEVARSLNNLAILHRRTRDYQRARPLYERALAIMEKALGPDHPDIARSLNNLASLLKTMGDYETARRHYQRALAIREKVLGPDHVDLARSLNNMANLLEATGDFDEARALHQRALEIRERALGPDHPAVADSLNNLAILLASTGDFEKARQHYQRALAIRETAYAPDHPKVATSYYNLAGLAALQHDREGALGLLRQALDRGFADAVILEDTDLDSLHGDPEFQAIVEEVRRRATSR